MKKSLAVLALALATGAWAQQQAQQPAQQPAQAGGQAGAAAGQGQPSNKKEIKDPAEYNAYITALNQQQPAAKAQALETFLQQYPNSVMKIDALELLMATYQQAGNQPKVEEWAQNLLKAEPNNLRALALLSYLRRASAEAGQNPQQNAQDARQYGEKGLQALQSAAKPDGMSDADFQKLKDQTQLIFAGAAGFGALQTKDYENAQKYLTDAVKADPKNLRNVYPLAVSYLEANPMNPVGLWYVGRAAALSQNNQQIVQYGRFKYIRYHGSDEGWQQLLTTTAQGQDPPQGFSVAPAPTLAEQAAALAKSKDPKQMDIAEWTMILTQAPQDVRDQVWQQIQGIKVPFAARVVEATKTTLSLAATADSIQQNTADVELTMAGPMSAAQVPKAGADVQVIGQVDTYTPQPFLLKLTDGQFIVTKKETAPARPSGRGRSGRH